MNKYLEEDLIKSECIFYKSVINRSLVCFTKPMIDYEILADTNTSSQTRILHYMVLQQALVTCKNRKLILLFHH